MKLMILPWLNPFIFFLLFGNVFHMKAGNLSNNTTSGPIENQAAQMDPWEQRDKNDDLPRFPIEKDIKLQSTHIFDALEVLHKSLEQFLGLENADLGTCLNYLIYKHTEPFVDEYGQTIRNYRKVFRFIWGRYNETLLQNYVIENYDKDKLDLCSVARYLSHQPTVENRATIMKRMGDALGYKCHPCTPYTPKQYGETIVPSTDELNPEGVSPEESLILCNETNMGQPISTPSTTESLPRKNSKEEENLELSPSFIADAHEIVRNGLREFLGLYKTDLGSLLSHLLRTRNTEHFVDEYGEIIRNYKKVFRFIWEQHNETLVKNYTVARFTKDRLYLCSIARYLSHQPKVEHRTTIMKRMGDALRYRCHPCTPYTPKQYDETIVPSTDDINPEGVTPEESLVLCNENAEKTLSNVSNMSTIRLTTTAFSYGAASGNTAALVPDNSESPLLDFSPCNYSNGDVVCNSVPLEDVQNVFRKNALPIFRLAQLILQPFILTETFIPEDVLGRKRVLFLKVQYPTVNSIMNESLSLQIDPNAFRSTKSYTTEFYLDYIDCTLLDFNFLTGFDKLNILFLRNVWNIQFCLPSLPSLPSLTVLRMDFCSGLDQLNTFPVLTNGLRDFQFRGFENDILERIFTDETVDRILDWILLSSSDTLEELGIVNSTLVTRVPRQIPSFKALRKLWLHSNNISTINKDSFHFTAPVSVLNIKENGIKEIEPNAFQGNFKDAEVYVYNNDLSRFDESVFGPILQQMANGKGFVNCIKGNRIDCSMDGICHLTWLLNYKVDVYFTLTCSNGTSFQDLQPSGFNHCS